MYKAVFSRKAFLSLTLEVRERIGTETGGILLGDVVGDIFYVAEILDPGPNSKFSVAYFEYDTPYVNHLANKVARAYRDGLKVIGLWHRHPASFSVFSSTDDLTNIKYAKLSPSGAISGLINIDPTFRLTLYHVTDPLKYTQIEYTVSDDFLSMFPKCEYESVISDINSCSALLDLKVSFDDILCVLETCTPIGLVRFSKKCDVDDILDDVFDDLEYLSDHGYGPICVYESNMLIVKSDSEREKIIFRKKESDGSTILSVKFKNYLYKKGMLKGMLS